jgi:hypothetical protein
MIGVRQGMPIGMLADKGRNRHRCGAVLNVNDSYVPHYFITGTLALLLH